jgi:hypothetical protein
VNEVRTEQLRGEKRIVEVKEFILVQNHSMHYLNQGDYILYDIKTTEYKIFYQH